jgi:hypothetical protein
VSQTVVTKKKGRLQRDNESDGDGDGDDNDDEGNNEVQGSQLEVDEPQVANEGSVDANISESENLLDEVPTGMVWVVGGQVK